MDPLRRFAEITAAPDEEIDLALAALAIAAAAEPGLDHHRWIAEIEAMAAGLSSVADLRRRLFEELGFGGDTQRYHDPQNSFLHRVIERRRGIPITLSVLAMEVGRRAGVALEGIGMPGHFLVRDPATGDYIDPFHGGEALDRRGCERRFQAVLGVEAPPGPELLPVVTRRQILGRMLANLRAIYHSRGEGRNLEWVVRMRLVLPETPAEEVLEVAEALALQGRPREGADELEEAAETDPELAPRLRTAAAALRASLN